MAVLWIWFALLGLLIAIVVVLLIIGRRPTEVERAQRETRNP